MATEEYLSTFRFSGDGVTLNWPVTFAGNHPDVASGTTPYISPADIEAIEVIPATDTSFEIQIPRELTVLGATSVRVSPAVASGRELIIRRRTEDRFNLVDFKTLQTVSEFDLDLANRQLLYLTQEATDRSRIAEVTAESSITTATNANITSVAALATADSAVVIADGARAVADAALSASATAVDTANAATVTADAATVTAGNAVDIAAAATGVADAARDVAEGIAGTAQNALDVANGIDGKATQALTNSNTAITTANEADAIARQALDTAEAQGVLSFNGREAVVVPEAGDYTAEQVTFGASNVAVALGNKVDKVAGKQLSTEDFTTPEKDKLSTLATDVAALTGRVSTVEGEKPLGWGQTWQNLTASRSPAVTYTNSTGRPIFIAIEISVNSNGLSLAVGAVTVSHINAGISISRQTVSGLVPAGATYRVGGAATIVTWAELR